MKNIHKIGKFYTRIIMKHIGIFIFIGFLSVVFHDHGWFPNEDIYAISQLMYWTVLPAFIAFEGGRMIAGAEGGILAVLAISGLLLSENSIGLLGAMLIGPFAGKLWKYEEQFVERYAGPSFQMLVRNLLIGVCGGILSVLGYFLVSPVLGVVVKTAYGAIDWLVSSQLIGLISIVIEPAKVFFLNNVINHTILVPIGIGQMQEAESSILFLLEANPGPGLGMMAALCYRNKEKRSEYVSAMIAQTAGGIHEVYFPFVLSDLRLLIPLILGGIAGNLCFGIMGAGLQGMVSPGSIFTIILMAGRENSIPVLMGICVSAVLSFAGSLVVMRWGTQRKIRQQQGEESRTKEEMQMKEEVQVKNEIRINNIRRIAFVCDGGVGSSAMGAALFRRQLAKEGIVGICVEAYAADMVPDEVELVVCQRNFYEMLPQEVKAKEVYKVESLMNIGEYENLLAKIRQAMQE